MYFANQPAIGKDSIGLWKEAGENQGPPMFNDHLMCLGAPNLKLVAPHYLKIEMRPKGIGTPLGHETAIGVNAKSTRPRIPQQINP